MTEQPWCEIKRKKTRQILVGGVPIGGEAPIAVQSMTNTPTEDVDKTLAQVLELEKAGADLVRVSCPSPESTKALGEIIRQCSVPIIADIHFHYARAIEAADVGAACLRVNPGNIGAEKRVAEVVAAAKANGAAIRIGVNAGSLEGHLLEKYKSPCPEAMVESALHHVGILEKHGFGDYKISAKASDIFLTAAAYRALSEAVDCPLHIGVTEAGGMVSGTVRSAIGLGALLWEGIGDTVRVSLSAPPVEEVKVGFEMLKALRLRHHGVTIISCPSCARQGFEVIESVRLLEKRLAHITAPITLSIIGCVVNGPGEAAQTDIGFTGGGKGAGMLYIQGKASEKLGNEDMIERIVKMVEDKAKEMEAV